MGVYLVRRTVVAALTLAAVSVVTFLLFFAAPTRPAEMFCGEKICSPAQLALTEHRLGLDQPLVVQYGRFVKGLAAGRTYGDGPAARHCPAPCLGVSFRTDEPVTRILARSLPVTLSIVVGVLATQLLAGVTLGLISAVHPGTVLDRLVMGTSVAFASVQTYFLGYLALIGLVYETGWLPSPSYSPITENPAKWAAGLILPWLTLGLLNAAGYARLTRAHVLETVSEDFVRTARAKGLRRRHVYGRHVLRATIAPIVTLAGLDLGGLLAGTVITETVFGLAGMGKTALHAALVLDMPVVMATVLVAALFISIANIAVDITYAYIDPRIEPGRSWES